MKKRLICLLLLLLLIPYAALAQIGIVPVSLTGLSDLPQDEEEYPFDRQQYLNCLVTVYRQQADGSFVPQTNQYQLAEINYHYTVKVGDDTGLIIGGNFSTYGGNPNTVGIGPSDFNAVTDFGASPVTAYVAYTNSGYGYQLVVRGGYFTISYNNVLYYDFSGNLLDNQTQRITERIAFNFTTAGTLEEVLASGGS